MATSSSTVIPLGFAGGTQGYTQQSDGSFAMDVTMAGSGTTASQVQGNAASGTTTAANPVVVGGRYNSTQPTFTDGQRGDIQLNSRGGTQVAGDNTAASDGISLFIAGLPDRGGAVRPFGAVAYVTNGTTLDKVSKATAASRIPSSAATTNATVAKASAGTLHAISGYNSNAAVRYLKIYNKATAPTVGTDTPILTLAIPATSAIPPTLLPMGMYFSAGISYALTTGAADADTAAVGAGDILGLNLAYS